MTTSLSLIQKPCQKIPGEMETEHLSDMDIGKELNIISWASKSNIGNISLISKTVWLFRVFNPELGIRFISFTFIVSLCFHAIG